MEQPDLARQTLVEQNLLTQLTEALRVVSAREANTPHRAATLRFISQAFRRHMERMLSLEEYDGYLDWVSEKHPQRTRAVIELRAEHDRLRGEVDQLVQALNLDAADGPELDRTCEDLLGLLRRLDAHSVREAALLQEAVGRDGGGEG